MSFYLEGFSYPRYYEMYRCMETEYDKELNGIFCRSEHPFAPHARYHGFLASSLPVYAYDGELSKFCGTTSTLTNLDASAYALFQRPDVVVNGRDCTNSTGALFILGGVLQHKLVLRPGEEQEIHYVFGISESIEEAKSTAAKYTESQAVERELEKTREYSRRKYSGLSIKTPDLKINHVMNSWLKKQVDFCIVGKKGVRDNLQIAAAEESVVLLKNENQTFPLKEHTIAAFFGRAQTETFFSGNGSGASKAMEAKNLLSECEKGGIHAVAELKSFYQAQQGKAPEKFAVDGIDITAAGELTSGFMYEIFGQYQAQCEEYDLPQELIQQAAGQTDTAVFVIGRNTGGEECDRHLEADYYLTDSEVRLLVQISGAFEKIILILNINGLIDLEWLEQYPMIQSVLFMGIPGEEGCSAVSDLLTGRVNPSGRLPVSIAKKYKDYPAAENFTWDKENPEQILTYESYGLSAEENGSVGYEKSPVTFYQEDLYAGYRYFDSFDKEVLFPFGYGLSYSQFEISPVQLLQCSDGIEVITKVLNVGAYPGKETVQVYLSCRHTSSERPYQELKGFEKTKLLNPGEEEELHIWIPIRELSCYVEERAAYVIEKGSYQFLAGNSSRQTKLVGEILMEEDLLMQQCANRLSIKKCNDGKLNFLSKRSKNILCWGC